MQTKTALLLFILLIAAVPAFAGGEQEAPGDTAAGPSQTAREVQQESTERQDLTPLQEKLGAAGFQLPRETFEAVDFTLNTLEGEEVSLFDYEGKLVFLNFWATWCPPCRAEMPSMEQVHNRLPADHFVMLAVNVNEPKEEVQAFIDENGYTFPVLLDSDGRVSSTYQVEGIPTTWLIGADKTVIGRLVGTTEWDTPGMMEIFNELIEKPEN